MDSRTSSHSEYSPLLENVTYSASKPHKLGVRNLILAVVFSVSVVVSLLIVVTSVGFVDESPAKAEGSLNNGLKANGAPSSSGQRYSPIVQVSQGSVIGRILKSRADRDYYAFYNIPYGEPPVGKLRFQPPVPAKNWEGVRNATVEGPRCLQNGKHGEVGVRGTEDCLYVNVYTPKLPDNGLQITGFPVIVFLYGGGFSGGTVNSYDPVYLMDEDVVIVMPEARLGALGFLNTGDMAATGNQCLKDQVLALEWVQRNIGSFGGDPARVVLLGSSSGSMCAHGHLLSPMTRGLISGVISMSGTMLNPGILDLNPRANAERLGRALGCPDLENSEELVKCLQAAAVEDIVQHQPDFLPSVEMVPADGNISRTFFPDTPINLMASGETMSRVPFMVGVNSGEEVLQAYSYILDPASLSAINDAQDPYLGMILGLPPDKVSPSDLNRLREFYFGKQSLSPSTRSSRNNLTLMINDRFWNHPTTTVGLWQARHNLPVYWYYYSKEANESIAGPVIQYFDPPYGASHGDSNQYFFHVKGNSYIPLDSPEAEFSIMTVKLLVSFAAGGVPVNPHPNGVKWPRVDPNGDTDSQWFNWDVEPRIMSPFDDRLGIWDSLPLNALYNQNATNSKYFQKRPGEIIFATAGRSTTPVGFK